MSKDASCSIDLCVWCVDEESYNKFYDIFVENYKGQLLLCPTRDNTNIQSAIWHSIEDDPGIDANWTFVLEAYLNCVPDEKDVRAIVNTLADQGKICGISLGYTDVAHKWHGEWKVTSDSMTDTYLPREFWPDVADCAHCDNVEAMCNNDLTGCDECLLAICHAFDAHSKRETIKYHNDKLKQEEEMDKDNLDRPKLDVTKEELKQIYDALENISCIDAPVITKLGKAPEVLTQVVNLANCLMAIWHGEAGNELSELDDVSESIHAVNSAVSDLADALRDIGAEV